jgi:decaprenylphospho-beta-D-erythro-pentofuranosid-2-ulose 2-reductase
MKKVLVLGATSAIAQATCRLLAARGASLHLVGRDAARLEAVARDLTVRGARVSTGVQDLNDFSAHEELVAQADTALGGMDGVLLAQGVLGRQPECERSWEEAQEVLTTNFMGPVSLLTHVANVLEQRREGTIVVLSSVAGDRGRQSNYVYGSSKGGLSVFVQGLRNRLARSNVAVVTIKPGFVDTPMTAHLPKNALFASPEVVARGILRAADARRDEVYVPGLWRFVMFAIRSIPEWMFKRMKL